MKFYLNLFCIYVFCIVLSSCLTAPDIPLKATPAQLIQLGQDALVNSNYRHAEHYYTAVIQRYGMDTALYIEARYELGYMYLKQKKYSKAYKYFNEIMEIFENAQYGSIPAAYKKLAGMGLERIPQKYKTNK